MAKIDAMLCFSLYSASLAMNRVYQPLLEELGLTYPQYIALTALWNEDAQPVGALGRRLGLETNTLTPLMKRLEAAGLVQRARNPSDERQVIVSLTPEGRALKDRAAHIPAAIFAATGMRKEEIAELKAQVDKLAANLKDSAPDRRSA